MKVQVLLFARAKDVAGSDRLTVDLPESARVGDLRAALASRSPELARMAPSLHFALGTDYAHERVVLDPNAEVACFPPVSGG